MGSKYSQSLNDNNKNDEKNYFQTKDIDDINEDEEVPQYMNYIEDSETAAITAIDDKKKIKNFVEYTFYWKGEGSKIFISTEFLNWKPIPMKKNPDTGIYEKKLNLPKKIIYFKFIIDDIWLCSDQYESKKDEKNNFINNYIDLTNYSNSNTTDTNEEDGKILKDTNKKEYSCRFPSIDELNINPPIIGSYLYKEFNINYQSNQDKLDENNDFLKYNAKNFNNENNTFKKITIFPHEKLMHLCTNFYNKGFNRKKYIQISSTFRNKHKYITYIYFHPT